MSNEYKLVPVEPTAEMLAELAAEVYPDDSNAGKALQRLRGCDVVFPKFEVEAAVGKYQRMLAAAPQPPALGGEPEVLAWMYRREGGEILGQLVAIESDDLKYVREGKYCEGRTLLTPRSDYYGWQALIDRAHLAPLQAEIERTNARLHDVATLCASVEQERDQLKARCDELDVALETAEKLLRNGRHLGQHGWQSCVEDFLRRPRQSALSKPAGSEQV